MKKYVRAKIWLELAQVSTDRRLAKPSEIFISWNIVQQLQGANYWYAQLGWISKTSCWVKEAWHKHAHAVWFHFYETLNKQNQSMMGKLKVVASGTLQVGTDWEGAGENLPEWWKFLSCFEGWLYMYTIAKIYWTGHLKSAHFFTYKLHKMKRMAGKMTKRIDN